MDITLLNSEQRLWGYLLTVVEAILVLFAIARLLNEKKQPSNTLAWLLAIFLLPWVGVPLYLFFGGRKLRRLAQKKTPIRPVLTGLVGTSLSTQNSPTAQIIANAGGSPAVGGNKVRLISNGEDAYSVLSEAIQNATESIHITTFILARDDTGKKILRLLSERARAGVKVRLLLDAVGCLRSSFAFCNELRRSGGEVCRFMPVFPFWNTRNNANLRNHRKIAVFDGKTAIIGGHNIGKEYMGPTHYRKRWRDVGALIQGPGAMMLNEIFVADWSFASQQNLDPALVYASKDTVETSGHCEIQVVASGPDVDGDPLYESILAMVQEASKSIWIVTPYFIPDEVLLRSLMVKARTGHEVVLIIPARSNHPITDFARRHYLRELQAAGAQIRFCGPGMMHSKGMVVDDRLALMGSANFDIRSLFVNFEVGVLLYSIKEVQELKGYMRDLLAHCVTDSHRFSKRSRLMGRIAEDLSRLFAPML